MVRPKLEPLDGAARLTYNPFRVGLSIMHRCIAHVLSPATIFRVTSHLVPLLVCLFLVPLVLLLSLFAGWYIWKGVPVAWQVPVYLQYGDGPAPYDEISLPALSTAQPYDISLQLVLPASEANFALGNFMASLSLSTPYNKTLVAVSRPAIVLPPQRAILSVSSVPRVIDLDVLLLSAYIPATSNMKARIDVGRRDGWRGVGNGEGRELSVLHAVLRGVVRRHGVWGLVSRASLIFALGASAAFFGLAVLALAACILTATQRRVRTDYTSVPEPIEDKPARVRKRPRRNVGVANSSAYKSENVPVDLPPAHAAEDSALRRRRSRTLVVDDTEEN